jgi:Ca2+-binding RTX toxin-like protein
MEEDGAAARGIAAMVSRRRIDMSTGIRRSTRNLAIGCTGALAVAVCGVAGAAQADANTTSVWKDGNTLRVSADYNVQNEILLGRNATDFFVTDFLDTVSPGAGCTAVVPPNPNMVRCSAAGITHVLVETRDRDDTVDVSQGDTPATIRGGSGADTLMGSSYDDRIEGGSGNDPMLNGDAGRDRTFGGSGDDELNTGDGDDYGEGGDGHDILRGGDDAGGVFGNDHLIGGPGRDTFDGGPGNDRLEGGAHSDTINGDDHDDHLIGGPGWDRLDGGNGTDRCQNGNDTKVNCEL